MEKFNRNYEKNEKQTTKGNEKIKIVNWNILAPGLLFYFWRSSYGLNLTKNQETYNIIQKKRVDNILKYLSKYNADIMCLQEVTNEKYPYLDNLTIQEYIGQELGYEIISESFKLSPFKYDYPPTEQLQKYSMDSGVATLVKINSPIINSTESIAHAEDFGQSKIFNSGIGSPFVVDKITLKNKKIIYLTNLHIRMEYPYIKRPLEEVYNRITQVLNKNQMKCMIVVGDFNAGGLKPAKDLFTSSFYNYLFDEQGHNLIDDHVFLGNNLRNYKINTEYDTSVILLDMNVNTPTSNPKWKLPNTEYMLSNKNNQLVINDIITTDHYPIIIDIVFDKIKRVPHQIGGRTIRGN